MSRPFEIEMPIPVRTYDVDFAGVVSNIVYIRWLEDMRLLMLDAYLPLSEQLAQSYGPIIAETQIQYKRPVRLLDAPLGRMWLTKLGRTSWAVQAEIWVGETVATTAMQRGIFINYETMAPQPVPAHIRTRFEQWSAPPG